MKRTAGAILPPFPEAAEADGLPLYLQLYRRIRSAILDGALAPGQRLPSSRTLAADLAMSRNTVELAFAQLHAEGYLERRVGSGSYVTTRLPEAPARSRPPARPALRAERIGPALSARGRGLAAGAAAIDFGAGRAFAPCTPSVEDFPLRAWNRLLGRRARRGGVALLVPGEPAGFRPLREAVAEHLRLARGVRCDWRQVVIVTSTQQALDLAARLLLDPGDRVWVEDPGYLAARTAFEQAGGRLVPVPVDGDGLDVPRAVRDACAARLAYVTPSHQYPLGATLSLERRLALLAWAERERAWIVEDDYDSEFRYDGRPLAAVQGLDRAGRVVYTGTFNKVLFPALRLAYVVAPESCADAFASARTLVDGYPPTLVQATLADFIAEGHFAAHVRQMRSVYRERRDALLEATERRLGGLLRVDRCDTGLHVVGWLPPGTDDVAVARRAADAGLDLPALSRYYLGRPKPGLLINFGSVPPPAIARGVETLAAVLHSPVPRAVALRSRMAPSKRR